MSWNNNENGNRPVRPGNDGLSASDFRLEFILTGIMVVFAAIVYTVLSVTGVTPGLSNIFGNGEPEPAPAAQHETYAYTSASDLSVSGADASPAAGESHDMGELIIITGRPTELKPDGATCTSYTCSPITIASVDDSGLFNPVNVGDVEVTGKTASGDTYIWHIKIKKVAYLMFSDFPNESTTQILDILKENDIKATFFVCKRSDESYFPIYRRILDEGHTMGNHTSSHDVGTLFQSTDELKGGISRLESFLDLNFSYRTKLVSIPNGTGPKTNDTVSTKVTKELHDMGYSLVDWTVEVGDYKEMTKAEIIDAVKNKTKNDREIISMHNYGPTVKALPEIIKWLRDNDYTFERLDDAPEVYNQYYGWEKNINQYGAGTYTKDMLSGFQYSQGS